MMRSKTVLRDSRGIEDNVKKMPVVNLLQPKPGLRHCKPSLSNSPARKEEGRESHGADHLIIVVYSRGL
jgi:hypothetical protein